MPKKTKKFSVKELREKITQTTQLISTLHIVHKGECSMGRWNEDVEGEPNTCVCTAEKERENLDKALKLLSLE